MGMFRDAHEDKVIECGQLKRKIGELKIQLNNDDYMIASLRKRMKQLTGCGDFGNMDGMNGACVECFYEDRPLWDKCEAFKYNKKGESI